MREGFEHRIRPLLPGLQRHALSLMGSIHDAEDLVQEVLMQAWQKLDSFRGESSLRTWIHSICSMKGIDALRKRKHRHMATLPEEPFLPPGSQDSSQELACLDLLDRLPPRDRERFFLREVEAYSWEEVAAMTGASVLASRTAHCRVLARLRKELQP